MLTAFITGSILLTLPVALFASKLKGSRNNEKFRKTEAGKKGIAYYKKAAELGNEEAKKKLKSMGIGV